MTSRHETRVALVTGGSSGIGKATAEMFSQAGWQVFGTSRHARPDRPGIVLTKGGHIDVLVNNAGAMHTGMAEETSLTEARDVMETNLFGVVRVTDAVLPHMRARRRGRIINVGSAAAWVGVPGEAFYAASKHALAGYTEALRHETRSLGIDVSMVEPGTSRLTSSPRHRPAGAGSQTTTAYVRRRYVCCGTAFIAAVTPDGSLN